MELLGSSTSKFRFFENVIIKIFIYFFSVDTLDRVETFPFSSTTDGAFIFTEISV